MILFDYIDPEGHMRRLELLNEDTMPGFYWCRDTRTNKLLRLYRNDISPLMRKKNNEAKST
jgi:hypothetical protein